MPGGTSRAVVVDHLRLVAGHDLAGRAGAHLALRRADEDVHHLGRADAVEDRHAGRLVPGLERRLRQRLAGRDAFAQRRDVVLGELAEHGAIGGRRREADRRAILCDRRQQHVGRRRLELDRGRADAEREQHVSAEPEREGERRRADEAVVALRLAARISHSCRSSPACRAGNASCPSARRSCRT